MTYDSLGINQTRVSLNLGFRELDLRGTLSLDTFSPIMSQNNGRSPQRIRHALVLYLDRYITLHV